MFTYIPSLDGLRTLAVISVLALHGSYGFWSGGSIGVDLFFVLSGYLITALLQNEYTHAGKINSINFYKRRLLRLFPPLLVCLLFTNCFWNYANNQPTANQTVATLASIFYFANCISWPTLGPLAHTWSLAVEEHFYVVWPIIAAHLVFPFSTKRRILLLAAAILVSVLSRIYVFKETGDKITFGVVTITSYRFTICRLYELVIGCLLAQIPAFQTLTVNKKLVNWLLYPSVIVFFLLSGRLDAGAVWYKSGGFLFVSLLCSLLVVCAILSPHNSLLSNRLTGWLGKRSYGIYLYHFPIFLLMENVKHDHSFINLVTVTFLRFFISFLAADLSYKYLEKPILKYKDQFAFRSLNSNVDSLNSK